MIYLKHVERSAQQQQRREEEVSRYISCLFTFFLMSAVCLHPKVSVVLFTFLNISNLFTFQRHLAECFGYFETKVDFSYR